MKTSVRFKRADPSSVPEIVWACRAFGIAPNDVMPSRSRGIALNLRRLAFWAAWCEGARVGKSRATLSAQCGIRVYTATKRMAGMPNPAAAARMPSCKRLWEIMRTYSEGGDADPLSREEIVAIIGAIGRLKR